MLFCGFFIAVKSLLKKCQKIAKNLIKIIDNKEK